MSARHLQQHPSPPALYRRCIFQRELLLTSVYVKTGVSVSLAFSITFFLSLPLFFSLFTPQPPTPVALFWASGSQRQTAHPSVAPAGSLQCWALSCTTQLLPSIKTCGWAGMYMHIHTRAPMPITPLFDAAHCQNSTSVCAHLSSSASKASLSQVHWDPLVFSPTQMNLKTNCSCFFLVCFGCLVRTNLASFIVLDPPLILLAFSFSASHCASTGGKWECTTDWLTYLLFLLLFSRNQCGTESHTVHQDHQ